MTDDAITEKTYDLLVKTLKIPREKITPEADLSHLAADSIQLFELVLAFETEFGLQAKYDDLMQITTVGDIIEYLKKNTSVA